MNPSTIATIVKISRIASALSFTAGIGAVIYSAVDTVQSNKRIKTMQRRIQDDLDNDPGLKLINDLFPN